MIIKTHNKKRLMKTELVKNIANEAIYQLEYYKNLYLVHKKLNKILLIIISTLFFCLITFLVYYYLKF